VNFDQLTLDQALDQAEAAMTALGIKTVDRLALIRGFTARSFVPVVTGLPGTGRSAAAQALATAVAASDPQVLDLRQAAEQMLWDLLVVVTPADRALSAEEVRLLGRARALAHPVLVLVSRVQVLGDGAERADGCAQIERVRLSPVLGPLGVPWFFQADEETVEAFTAAASAVARDPATAGRRPAIQALDLVLADAADQLADRVAARDAEFADLLALLAQSASANTYLAEQVKLSRVRALDPVRSAETGLTTAVLGLPEAAAAWLANDGLGAWSDVEHDLRAAWERLLAAAEVTLDAAREKFAAEVAGLAEAYTEAAERLGMPPLPAPELGEAGSWATAETGKALAALSAADFDPLLLKVENLSREELRKHDRSQTSNPIELAGRAVSAVQDYVSSDFTESLRMHMSGGLEAVLRLRLDTLLAAYGIAAQEGAGRDLRAASDWFAQAGAQLRAGLEQRHAWGSAYGELLELRAWTGQASRHAVG